MAKKSILFTLFIMFALFSPLVSASHFKVVSIKDTIDEKELVKEEISFFLENNTQDYFEFTLPKDAKNVYINNESVVPINQSVMVPLSCSSCQVHLSYDIDGRIQKDSKGIFIYSRTLNLQHTIGLLEYTVSLPPGYIIERPEMSAEPSIVPPPSEIRTDGRSIIIQWSEKNPGLPIRYFISYHTGESELGMNVSEELEEPVVILLVAAALAIGVAIGYSSGFFISKRKTTKTIRIKQEAIPSSLLTPSEKEIISLLQKNNGEMTQKDVVRSLEWSKSKVSAVMTMLDSKKIVKREKFGRNYKVTLDKKINLD